MLATIEKVVPTLEDAPDDPARAGALGDRPGDVASTRPSRPGPRAPADPDGPSEYHVVLLDNGRSGMLGTEFQDMLRCIRCGACMNHCPVYHAVGGHAYGWVYPGPMGAVLTPALIGIEKARHLPNASTFCGRCESVCPMRIPLPKMMRHWREQRVRARALARRPARYGLRLWAFLAPAAGALPPRRAGSRMRPARPARPQARPLQQPAARRRLDRLARPAGAARADLPGAVARPRGSGP